MGLFDIGQYYPHPDHIDRIKRYQTNKKMFKGEHYDIFGKYDTFLSKKKNELVYISVNLPGLICKKSADFLFGETPRFDAGTEDQSNEQKALDRMVSENKLSITNYESALGNSYRGDSFYKIRWGQRWDGRIDKKIDPFRVFIEAQNAMYVFPETSPSDANTIFAYHIAYPVEVQGSNGEQYILKIESHYPGRIIHSEKRMHPFVRNSDGSVHSYKIYADIPAATRQVDTGVPMPLVVHIPNYATDDSYEGIDDLSDNDSIFSEINSRLSRISEILDKHSDPAIAVPEGSLEEDEKGNPVFRVGLNKVFEVRDKNDVVPQYITWNGQLESAFKELEKLLELVFMTTEIPPVVVGKDNSGTSGASGLSIKWRMNTLLSKINRKRQYFDKGLKEVLLLAQLLEHAKSTQKPDYQVTTPRIIWKDGLPDDDLEQANIASIRTGGKPTMSQKTAIMTLNDMTEEQAARELERIRKEEEAEAFVNSSVFHQDEDDE